MLRTVEGVFQHGRVELKEVPVEAEGTRVLVTFLPLSLAEAEATEGSYLPDDRWHWEEVSRQLEGIGVSGAAEVIRQRREE